MQQSKSRATKKLVTSTAFAGMVLAAPTLSHAELGDQTLKKGMTDPDVKQLQNVLKDKGYFHYKESTGYFGSITKKAVSDFQRKNGLKTNGVASKKTIRSLNGKKKVKVTSNRLLRTGSRGQAVTNLQSELKELGFYKGNLDGIFGSLSDTAVKGFQHAHSLKADGIAGPKTLGALNGKSSGKSTAKNNDKHKKESSGKKTTVSKKILRVGSRGQAVTNLQKKLDAGGYYTYNIDGIYGSITATAVRKFQRAHKLKADGITGSKTFSALNGSKGEKASKPPKKSSASKGSSSSNGSSGMLSIRDRSSAVTNLQKKLKKAGVFHQAPTGYFGVATDKAVQTLQRKYGLTVDGIVGPKTKNKLAQATNSGGHSSGGGSTSNKLNLVADASHLLGVPYQWGGTTPSGFDCSGFVQYVFKKNGISLNRTVATQWNSGNGKKISQAELRPGDVVFYQGTYAGAHGGPSHNGIYIGNGEFIQSGSKGVATTKMSYSDWTKHYLGAKRFN